MLPNQIFDRHDGNILIEACVCLVPLLFAILLNFELIRRAHFEVVSHHALFLYARYRALGLGRKQSKQRIEIIFKQALPGNDIKLVSRLDDCEVRWGDTRGLKAFMHHEYPQFIPTKDPSHKRFQMTRTCRFFF